MESKEGTLIQTSLYWRERSEKAEQQVVTLTESLVRLKAYEHLAIRYHEQVVTLTEALTSAQRVILQGDVPYKDAVLVDIAIALAAVSSASRSEDAVRVEPQR